MTHIQRLDNRPSVVGSTGECIRVSGALEDHAVTRTVAAPRAHLAVGGVGAHIARVTGAVGNLSTPDVRPGVGGTKGVGITTRARLARRANGAHHSIFAVVA